MHVSICNPGQLPERVVLGARTEAAYVFSAAGVELVWHVCGSDPPEDGPLFSIRLRTDTPPSTRGPVSLDAMGRAFIDDDGSGALADVYYQAAESVARKNGVVETDALLGHVIAHEIGHLLLGPGHTPDGIMRAQWNALDMARISRRWMRFNADQRSRIHCELQSPEAGEADGAICGKCENEER